MSISDIARAMNVAFPTVKSKIADLNIEPSKIVGRSQLFDLNQLVEWRKTEQFRPFDDDTARSARDTDLFYASELKRLRFEQEVRELYSGDEVRAGLAKMCRVVAEALARVPDQCEITLGAEPEIIDLVSDAMDVAQAALFAAASEAFPLDDDE